ncbi:MAG: hypothetical protein MK180_16950 [Rhodobacteraceae bacterium]|nr:hypothetical protein [Paracoccaceae bacterium]
MIGHLFIAMIVGTLSSVALLTAGYGFLVAFLAYSAIGSGTMLLSAVFGVLMEPSKPNHDLQAA